MTANKLSKKQISYLNIIAVFIYVIFVFYKKTVDGEYLNAVIFSCFIIAFFSLYFPVESFLLKRFKEKLVFCFLTVPFVIVCYVFHVLVMGW